MAPLLVIDALAEVAVTNCPIPPAKAVAAAALGGGALAASATAETSIEPLPEVGHAGAAWPRPSVLRHAERRGICVGR